MIVDIDVTRWVRGLVAFSAAAAIFCSAVYADTPDYTWKLSGSQDGIRVFTSTVERHSYDAVKVVAVVPTGTARLLGILQQFEAYTAWYYRAAEVRVLLQPALVELPVTANGAFDRIPNLGPWLMFFRQHVPPISDRWTILRASTRSGPQGSLMVEFHSHAQPFSEPDGAVKMDLRGYWQLRPLGPARTEVTFMVDVDPNTALPAFVVDPQLQNAVVQTMAGLKKQALGQPTKQP